MQRWHRELQTNHYLWVICSTVIFGALGFFEPLPNAKGSFGSLWGWIAATVRDEIRGDAWVGIGQFHLGYAILFYIPIGVIAGWVMQAMIVALCANVRRNESAGS